MSDPVTNVEIEDVLSSIRRLVSEEGRNEPRSAQVEPERKADKLVLTPALRVTAAEPETEIETPGHKTKLDSEAPWSDPEATLYEAAQAATDDTQEDIATSKPEPMILRAEDAVVHAEPVETPVVDVTDAEPDAYREVPEDTVEVEEVEPGDVLDESDHEPLAEELEETVSEPESLSSKIEALEAVIAETPDQWEPDGESPDAYSGTPVETIKWQDHEPDTDDREVDVSEAEDVVEEPVPFDEAGVPDAAPDALEPDDVELEEDRTVLTPDETILDEESLRELIADIVREELQGALGERITRNVRKLVRREIHRALTAHELE